MNDIKKKIWQLIKSKDPINIALAIELAEGQAIDLASSKLISLYNQLYPFSTTSPKKEKLIRLFSSETLNLTEAIPKNIHLLPNLEHLTLDGMTFYKFDLSLLQNCKSLESLKLMQLKQQGLGRDLYKISTLKTLQISFSKIGYLHPNIGKIKALKTLRIEHTDIKVLPEELTQLQSLNVLTLIQPKLELAFLDIIAQMPQLKIIRLAKTLLQKTERQRLQKALPNSKISYV
jgi:Leucine-rich repeat (LRR) protein